MNSQSSGIFFHEINDGLQTQASILSLNNFRTTRPPNIIDNRSHDTPDMRMRSHSGEQSDSSSQNNRSSTSDLPGGSS